MKNLVLTFVFVLLLFAGCKQNTNNVEPTSPEPTATATPVCDILFGYNLDNDSNNFLENSLVGSLFEMSDEANINRLSVKLNVDSDYSIGIYTDNAGEPGTLLVETGIKNGLAGWNTADIGLTTLSSGEKYWLISITQNKGVRVCTSVNRGYKGYTYAWSDIVSDGMPSSLSGWISVSLCEQKIYASYCN
ncbi:MAG: hypothetical protein JXR81_07395 [Candidatus Goldbacteria bacterium]|nr:hypothetical protein [Candidatus Goldiibacteriota bacterium]